MTPEIRNQSCHPRLALTKALGIYTVYSRKTARLKGLKNIPLLLLDEKEKKKEKEGDEEGWKRTKRTEERIPLAPVFGYGSADDNNARNSKLGSLFVSS